MDYSKAEVMESEVSVHENMIKILNAYNSLGNAEKQIILAACGYVEDFTPEAKMVLDIINHWPHDYKSIFISLVQNNAKLSWSTGDTNEGQS